MKHSIVNITPEYAAFLLESNSKNRKLNDDIVAQYARDMTSGKWQTNGETIKISKTNVLLDGQHRLYACIRSGNEFQTVLVEGLEDEAFTTIDVGKKRTAAQILAIAGHVGTHRLAAAVRYVNAFERKLLRPNVGGSHKGMTSQQILEWIEAHSFIIEACKEGKHLERLCSAAAASAAYYTMWIKDSELCHKYFVDIFSGENLKRGDPALAVRNRLISREFDKSGAEQLVIIIRGWNALRKNEELQEAKGFVKSRNGEYISPDVE